MAKGTPKSSVVVSASQKITPFLMFSKGTSDAVKHYVATFPNARIISMGEFAPGMTTATFELEGQRFLALDGGPHFSFSEGLSLFVSCKTQTEVDHYWEKLSKGGTKSQCGWVKDKWGVSWQIVPESLGRMLGDSESGNSAAVMAAMLKMGKLDIKTLEAAYNT